MAKERKDGHRISLDQGSKLTRTYRQRYGKSKGALRPVAYTSAIFEAILGQPGCAGIRFYPGVDAKGRTTLVMVGFTQVRVGKKTRYDDLVGSGAILAGMKLGAALKVAGTAAGIVGDVPFRCPPYCSAENPLNS